MDDFLNLRRRDGAIKVVAYMLGAYPEDSKKNVARRYWVQLWIKEREHDYPGY